MSDEEKRTEEELESAKTEESVAEADEATSEAVSAATEAETAAETKSDAEVVPAAEAVSAVKAKDEHHDDVHLSHDHGHTAHGHDAHGHDAHGHGDEHFAHTAPAPMLLGVFGALIVLTILTVAVTAVDLGANGNLVVAMVIATVKAALVMGFFMHMFWDSKFNVMAFTSSFLFVILFLAMTLTDRGEYQNTMNQFEADKKAIELAK